MKRSEKKCRRDCVGNKFMCGYYVTKCQIYSWRDFYSMSENEEDNSNIITMSRELIAVKSDYSCFTQIKKFS